MPQRRAMLDIKGASPQVQEHATCDAIPVWVLAERLYEMLQNQPRLNGDTESD
jgi:hypothetical protein